MNRVLVICSTHHEVGRASSSELHWLLSHLRPEVVFLEHSASELDAFLEAPNASLELAAAVRYRDDAATLLVPVGMQVPEPENIKSIVDAMFDRIETGNPRYCRLLDEYDHHIYRGGLAFLNSRIGTELRSEIEKELRRSVATLNETGLTAVFERWSQLNDLRERAMIREIEHFAERRPFNKAVLIVGSAHQLALYAKTRQLADSSPIAWDFDWQFDDEAPAPKGL